MEIELTKAQKGYLKNKFGILAKDKAKVELMNDKQGYLFIKVTDEFESTFYSKLRATQDNLRDLKGKIKTYNSDRSQFIV